MADAQNAQATQDAKNGLAAVGTQAGHPRSNCSRDNWRARWCHVERPERNRECNCHPKKFGARSKSHFVNGGERPQFGGGNSSGSTRYG